DDDFARLERPRIGSIGVFRADHLDRYLAIRSKTPVGHDALCALHQRFGGAAALAACLPPGHHIGRHDPEAVEIRAAHLVIGAGRAALGIGDAHAILADLL